MNIEEVEELLGNYKSNPADWRKYAKFDKCKYTRNLVHEGNGKFNLMLLCWAPGKSLWTKGLHYYIHFVKSANILICILPYLSLIPITKIVNELTSSAWLFHFWYSLPPEILAAKWVFVRHQDLKSVNLQYITLGCLDDGTNKLLTKSDVPSIIFLYFL